MTDRGAYCCFLKMLEGLLLSCVRRMPQTALDLGGVNDGIRTRDHRNHNPALYQLSYAHHYRSGRTVKHQLQSSEAVRLPRIWQVAKWCAWQDSNLLPSA